MDATATHKTAAPHDNAARVALARLELSRWVLEHPGFSTADLLDAWTKIRQAHGLGPKARPRIAGERQ